MPKESLSVYLTAVDGMSPVLVSITDKTKALDKESQALVQSFVALQKANEGLIKKKTELQKQLNAANKEVKEAQKNFNALGDEANSEALNMATQKQQDLKAAITATTKSLQENQKQYKENIETFRKNTLSNDSLKGGLEGQGTGLDDIAKGLFAVQVGQMFSSSLGGLGQSVLSSAIGTPEASLISDALSSAISGGAAGAIFGPAGIAAGAVLGGVSGLISGGTKIFEAKDDAFKDYYGGLYEDAKGRSGEMVESGSAIAGGREQTRMAFSQRLGGDERADAYLAEVEKMAASTNYEYDEIVGYAKLLLNSYDPGEVFGVLQKLSDATAGLDLSSGDVNMMISGLSRMRTTGKATQEYLNYFRERGVDTDQALADALTESTGKAVSKSAIADLVSKGKINGEDAAEAILDFIQQEFGGLSDTLAGTYDAMADNLGDIESSLQAAGGDAYNSLRKAGVNEQMLAYGGELGDAIKEINAVMGENQARKENLQEQYMREALDTLLTGKRGTVFTTEQQVELNGLAQEFAAAKRQYEESERTDTEAGAKMESLYEQAQILGQAYFDNSDFVKILNETEQDEIEAIRRATAGLENAYSALYELNQTMSKGLAVRLGGIWGGAGTPGKADQLTTVGGHVGIAGEKQDYYTTYSGVKVPYPHAFGLDRVPYDDYPALLHEGERVLTAAEARAQDAGAVPSISLTVTGNSFNGTSEEMADQLWEIIMRKLEQAYTAAAPK